ncbi:MAG: ABC transporter permease, partial [Bacteroidales bacterium]|nr:ABC transporter permease [Bacteroidales bacterium]
MKQILKMLWNQKQSCYWIFIEQILVAVVLMLSLVSLSEAIHKYRMPGLLNTENMFCVGWMSQNASAEVKENTRQSMDVIIEHLKKLPYVTGVTRGYNLAPYQRDADLYAQMGSDSFRIDDKQFLAVVKFSDESGASVLNIEMEEGTWLENRVLEDGSLPVVITRQFADKVAWSTALGKKIPYRSKFLTVAGVAAGLKQEPFAPSPVAIVVPRFVNLRTSEDMVKIKPGMEREFIEAYNKEFTRLISDERVEPVISDMQELKRIWVSQSLLPVVLQAIPTLFLFIFAFIGTFGLYQMSSQKRMREFALRIALGSTPKQLTYFVLFESLLVTAFAILP